MAENINGFGEKPATEKKENISLIEKVKREIDCIRKTHYDLCQEQGKTPAWEFEDLDIDLAIEEREARMFHDMMQAQTKEEMDAVIKDFKNYRQEHQRSREPENSPKGVFISFIGRYLSTLELFFFNKNADEVDMAAVNRYKNSML